MFIMHRLLPRLIAQARPVQVAFLFIMVPVTRSLTIVVLQAFVVIVLRVAIRLVTLAKEVFNNLIRPPLVEFPLMVKASFPMSLMASQAPVWLVPITIIRRPP